jgi:anthranilate phosphoribosyltransferase
MLLVGVARPELTTFIAACLARLGARRAWVVYGSGLDEIALDGPTAVAAINGGRETFEIAPEHAGLARADRQAVAGGDAQENAAIAREILEGGSGPRRDVILLNAAAALLLAGRAADLRQGAAQAAAAIDERRALALLERVKALTNS